MLSRDENQLRYRHTVPSATKMVQSTLQRSYSHLKKFSSRIKLLIATLLLVSILFTYYLIYHVFDNHLEREYFLETHKCPACYGDSLCFSLFNGDFKMAGASKFRFLDFTNDKNVHFGMYGSYRVVFKKLGSSAELDKLDLDICEDANRQPGCDIARVVHGASFYRRVSTEPNLSVNVTTGLSDMMTCPTSRLMRRIEKMYREKSAPDVLLNRDKISLLTMLRFNPHPLMLQTFPAKDGWPFPEYFGACGRFIAESYAGKTLDQFHDAPFYKRVDIAFQIMKMAELLSENADQFGLYWTDLSYGNLAVSDKGTVTLIDLEHVIVVDKLRIKKEKQKGWDEFHHSEHQPCSTGRNCLSFSTTLLCNHADSDHNVYVACASLLSPSVHNDHYPGGFLHDMPDVARDDWELDHLLRQCTNPTVYKGRHHIKDKLIHALDKLRIILLSDHPEKYSGHFQQ